MVKKKSDDFFANYPMHIDDIKKLSDSDKILKELELLPKEREAKNFEEFWIARVGKTLYERFNKFYNLKAWQLNSNTEMNFGFKGTVKRKPLETGSRYEFHTGYFNEYPGDMLRNNIDAFIVHQKCITYTSQMDNSLGCVYVIIMVKNLNNIIP